MPTPEGKLGRKSQRKKRSHSEDEDSEYQARPFPLLSTDCLTGRSEPKLPAHHVSNPLILLPRH